MKLFCAAAFAGLACAGTRAAERVLPFFPSLSPDGGIIAFSWAGDLWAVGAGGGIASRLTSHPADENRSAFSPDGTTLAFESNRDGPQNLYVIDLIGEAPALAAGPVRRVTELDRSQVLSAFTSDGSALLCSGRMEPTVHRHGRMFAAPLAGGPIERLTDAFGIHPKPMPDGGTLFVRGRETIDRPRYRGSGAMDLYRLSPEGEFERLTSNPANDFAGHPMPDGSVVFLSSRDGQNNVYRLAVGATDDDPAAVRQLTRFMPDEEMTIGHGVRDLAVSADGSRAAFVVWDTLYTLDLTRSDAQPVEVTIRASADDSVPEEKVIDVSTDASEFAWHPSGDAVAIVSRGEIWLRSTAEGRPTRRVTRTPWRERDIAWSPDGERLYFSADDDESLGSIHAVTVALAREDLAGAENEEADSSEAETAATESSETGNADETAVDPDTPEDEAVDEDEPDDADADDSEEEDKDEDKKKNVYGARWAESLAFVIEPVVVGDSWDRAPRPSPDGRTLLFTRGLGDLMHLDLQTGEQRRVLSGWDAPDVQWLPDSRHIVYARNDLDFNSDVWLLELDAGGHEAAINLTRHPDIDRAPRLSADGKVLVFLSDRAGVNWSYDVHRVYLDRALDDMTSYELGAYFEEAAKAAKKRKPLDVPESDDGSDADAEPLILDADDAWLRIARVTSLPGSERDLAITPGGDRIIFGADVDGSAGLYSIEHDGSDRKRITSGGVSGVTTSLTGTSVAFLSGGRVTTASPTGSGSETYPISGEVRIQTRAEQRQKFLEGARAFGATFYNIKGIDWAALTDRYLPLVELARTSSEFNRLFRLLLGEVNGSHTGIRGGGGFSAEGPGTGYLGIDAVPESRGYRVTRVLNQGPSAKGNAGLLPGDLIVSIDREPISQGGTPIDLRTAMTGAAGRETLVEVQRGADEATTEFVLLTPHSYGVEFNLRYDDEIETRRAAVERLSEGRLGYLHIRGMNLPSVRDFERDLYAAAHGREGLVIDVRDNGGGFTTDILLASLTAPRHAYTIPRGAAREDVSPDTYPRDRRLIYGWTRPVNVLINQNSFSNAEIFSHAIKTSGRGRLVGVQTFGGVISTGGFSLIDGTFVRRPFRGWYLPDGRDMDVYGAEPDVPVSQTPTDEAAGLDSQLVAAVRDLLEQIDLGLDSRAIRP